MEINLNRMMEYNSYNSSILSELYSAKMITETEYKDGLKAVESLYELYNAVKRYNGAIIKP